MKFFRCLVLCLGILVFLSGVSLANTFYVATTGDDARSCSTAQNIATPKRTIQSGLGCIAPGDTLYIRAGTYGTIDANSTTIPSGTTFSDAPLISGYPSEVVTIQGKLNLVTSATHHVIFSNLIIDANHSQDEAVSIGSGAHHVRLKNCEVKNSTGQGVHMSATGSGGNEVINCSVHNNGVRTALDHGFYIETANNLIEGCDIYNNIAFGIQIYAGNPNGNTVRKNIIRNNSTTYWGAAGGMVNSGDSNLIYNNIFLQNSTASGGSGLINQGSNAKIYNNTFYANADYGIEVYGGNPTIMNNIFWQNGSGAYSGSATASNNLLNVDPKFVSQGTNDFHLQSGSPAINAGATLTVVTTDFAGTVRPQGAAFDIGAYEFTTTASLPPPTNLAVSP